VKGVDGAQKEAASYDAGDPPRGPAAAMENVPPRPAEPYIGAALTRPLAGR
jgi:hypothetical protein